MTRISFVLLTLVGVLSGCASATNTVTWRWGDVMPEARSARATCAAGHRIVTIGGTSWPEIDGQKVKRWHRSVFVYQTSPVARAGWSRLPDYPVETGYAAAFAVGETVIAIGGRDGTTTHTAVFTIDLDTAGAGWRPGPALPRPMFGLVGGVIDDTIYVTGGFEPDGDGGHHPASDVLALDLSQPDAAWRTVGRLPRTEVAWPVAATCDGRLYVFGGSGDGVPLDAAWAFDPARGTWQTCHAMPVSLSSGAAASYDAHQVLVAGGSTLAVPGKQSPDGKPRTPIAATCLLYDTRRDRYRAVTPMLQAVLDQGLVVIGGTIYSFGGEESPHRTRTDLMQVGRLE